MKNIFLISLLFLSGFSFSQNYNKNQINYIFKTTSTIQKIWRYFKLTDTIEVKIINHIPAGFFCGSAASASMTIVEIENGDIIRVLDLCNLYDEFEVGQIIKVLPAKKPEFNVSLPFNFVKNIENSKTESVTKKYDTIVINTAYGYLQK